MDDREDLRYPLGLYTPPDPVIEPQVRAWIDDIAELPAAFHAAVTPLTDAQLDTPYRPGGWTVRQIVHHVPDSHVEY